MEKPVVERWPPNWNPAEDIPSIVNSLNIEKPIGIEIGVDCAQSSMHMLEFIPNLTLYGVDPYEEYPEMSQRQISFDYMKRYTAYYGDQFKLIQKRSDDAVADFKDESVDFIFIDGMHAYHQVIKDIRNYYPKIKKGGYIFGHDYKGWATNVDKAVDEFAAEINVTVQFCNQDVWYWRKA